MAIDRDSVRHFRNEWEANQASYEAKILVAPPAIYLSDLDGMAGIFKILIIDLFIFAHINLL